MNWVNDQIDLYPQILAALDNPVPEGKTLRFVLYADPGIGRRLWGQEIYAGDTYSARDLIRAINNRRETRNVRLKAYWSGAGKPFADQRIDQLTDGEEDDEDDDLLERLQSAAPQAQMFVESLTENAPGLADKVGSWIERITTRVSRGWHAGRGESAR